MNRGQSKRSYETKPGTETEIAVLPGEDPLSFELLLTQISEEQLPDGPLQEDAVLTIAKCIWRKRRHQRFLVAKYTTATFDPASIAYDGEAALTAFYHLLLHETDVVEIKRLLHDLGGFLEQDLLRKCPRGNFPTVKAWIKAMQRETKKMLSRTNRFGSAPAEVLMAGAAAVFTDEELASELDLEERNNAQMEKAISLLIALKATEKSTFREVLRFNRTHPKRLARVQWKA